MPSPRRDPPRRRTEPRGKIRLQRVLAAAGVAARRAAERLIEEGRVQINGETVTTLPAFVDPENDRITVDGRPIPRQPARHIYIMLNKPPRVLAVSSDEPGLDRRTIMDLVDHPAAQRLFPIGRLDYETSGLILLTNDGQLANRLTHPRYGVPRRYQAVVKGSLNDDDLRRVQKDLLRLARRAAGERARQRGRPAPAAVGAGAIELSLAKREPDRTTIDITIHHGRIGEIGELLAAAGIRAKKLQRTGIGPLELKGLARGQWRELERHELQALRSVGKATAASNKPSPEDRKTPARRTQARRGNSS